MDKVEGLLYGEEKKTWAQIVFYGAAIIGIFMVLKCILSPMFTCCRFTCRAKQDLMSKYGRSDSLAYAVVTGGSDGIGLQLCH